MHVLIFIYIQTMLRFDSVYEDDLPGFVAIKTQFWDNHIPEVECFLRRRTLEGDWIWLATKVLSYIHDPVLGVIAEEREVEDAEHASQMNRIIRVTAILIQAVQSATRAAERKAAPYVFQEAVSKDSLIQDYGQSAHLGQNIPLVADDAMAYQKWLEKAAEQSCLGATMDSDPFQALVKAAVNGVHTGQVSKETLSDDPIAALKRELMNGDDSEERKGFDPLSALKEVRGDGTRVDLGMVPLSMDEVKMVTLVLTGKLPVEQLAPLVHGALNAPGESLTSVLSRYVTHAEKREQKCHHTSHGGRPHQPSSRFRKKSRQTSQGSRSHSHSPHAPSETSGRRRTQRDAPAFEDMHSIQPEPRLKFRPSAISVVSLSYTHMGNEGMEMFGELIYAEGSILESLDVSFCALDERGILSLARSLAKRKRRGIAPLRGLVISGNHITYRAAKDLGTALAPGSTENFHPRKRNKVSVKSRSTGYDDDIESDDDDLDEDAYEFFGKSGQKRVAEGNVGEGKCCSRDVGLQVLHIGSTSLTPEALYQLLEGLGPHCTLKELSIASNKIGPAGASLLVDFLEGKGKALHPAMPYLDRLDLSNNELGNDGTAKLTRAVAKRVKNPFVDLRLSCNDIGHGGIETIMNKLLQHSIISLSLDKNSIGDQGCQLVAASLQSMHSLSRLNLSFNQIGSRGVTTLMKSLIACESITYLGLSGNIMKISGAIAMGFTLAQHPRLEELDLDNCCLSQAAQCHVVSGIISNRWVPMKSMRGFQAGPPMVAINAIGVYAHNLSNEECFRIKRDEQMKTILQWMESNRAARENPRFGARGSMGIHADSSQQQYLTPHFVSEMNEVHGTPSQNAYLRMLGWLSKIPFDEDELNTLRQYFYGIDGGEGDRGSDGYINLKLRGDLLAALDSCEADEIRDQFGEVVIKCSGSVGLDIDQLDILPDTTPWHSLRGGIFDKMPAYEEAMTFDVEDDDGNRHLSDNDSEVHSTKFPSAVNLDIRNQYNIQSSLSSLSRHSMMRSTSDDRSFRSGGSALTERRNKARTRIRLFRPFELKLEELKSTARDMMEHELDPDQQDVILTQYAEASLTILRQLRYHCMNSGLDGWRQSGLRRKVLIVDDSLVTRKMVARAFEKANFIVDTAENGVEGVKKMKAQIYDIAFMDIDMPVMNGFEATKALRQWEDTQRPGARQPICALTAAYVDDFERSELMKFKEAGLDVMESKPCNIPRLFKVVDDVSPMFSDLSISVSQGSFGSM